MVYSEKMKKAIKFAIKTHDVYQEQKRKGKGTAYITHPLTVGLLLALVGAKEDVVIAGILHDTIEDSVAEKKVTPAMVHERFGKRVEELVVSVTETDKKVSWAERKALALENIMNHSEDSILIKSADVLSNGAELVDDYLREKKEGGDGSEIFGRFKASASDTLINYERVISALLMRWPESPFVLDLKKLDEEIKSMKKQF